MKPSPPRPARTAWLRGAALPLGGASYEEVVKVGQSTLTEDDVLEGVPERIGTIKIECLFGDGMRVLHVEGAIGPGKGGLA